MSSVSVRRSFVLASRGITSMSLRTQRLSQTATIGRSWFSSYPPHEVVGLPALSPTMESGTIASWNKEEGDSFGPGEVLCSVETDKATVDFEAQDDGVIAKILAEAGPTEIQCGEPILITVEEEGDVAAFKDYVAEPTSKESGATEVAPAPLETTAAAEAKPVVQQPTPASEPVLGNAGSRVVASPLAHMLAKDMGHDISSIRGSGPGGRIIAADVREFVPLSGMTASDTVTSPATAMGVDPVPGSGYMDYPISETAKEIAQRLSQSKKNVPHYYLTVDVSMDKLLEFRDSLSAGSGEEKSLGVYEFIVKAAAASMKAVPTANAAWMDSVVRVYDSVDVNVVVGTGDDLYAPVIRDCGRKGIKVISNELNGAVDAIENDDLNPEFAATGTVTVMNLGMYGIKSCAPIIREPQSVALAIGALENRIVPNDDPDASDIYKEGVMMTATLSCDHRVVDGAVGAQWLSAFKSFLENPATLLL